METLKINCVVCGTKLTVELKKGAGMNKDGHYFGTIRRGIGMWSSSKAVQNPDGSLKLDENGLIIWERCHSRWKELWFRLIDLKRLLLHQYKDVEYWECDKCFNK